MFTHSFSALYIEPWWSNGAIPGISNKATATLLPRWSSGAVDHPWDIYQANSNITARVV